MVTAVQPTAPAVTTQRHDSNRALPAMPAPQPRQARSIETVHHVWRGTVGVSVPLADGRTVTVEYDRRDGVCESVTFEPDAADTDEVILLAWRAVHLLGAGPRTVETLRAIVALRRWVEDFAHEALIDADEREYCAALSEAGV